MDAKEKSDITLFTLFVLGLGTIFIPPFLCSYGIIPFEGAILLCMDGIGVSLIALAILILRGNSQ